MKKILTLTTCMLLIVLSSFAQNKTAAITFKQTTHDFGTFAEELGKVTTEFTFTNTGNAPLLITRTAASCGCTTPEYPKEPIAPGKSGVIKVTYNAKGRPGVFQKTVYVFANTDPEKNTLIIKGKVNPAPPKKEDNFPKEIGELRLKSKYIPFFDVYPNTTKTESIEVYNPTSKPIVVSFAMVPKHLKVVATPSTIGAKKEGKITVTYVPDKAKDWGMRKDNFQVLLGDDKKSNNDNTITVSADIREDFGNLTAEQKAKAPAIALTKREINFGKVSSASTHTITITNNGKSDLVIRKIKNDNRAFECTVSKNTIAPGKTATLKITCISSKATSRVLSNNITVISNDPLHATMDINLLATVN